jgi:hypothetical protein
MSTDSGDRRMARRPIATENDVSLVVCKCQPEHEFQSPSPEDRDREDGKQVFVADENAFIPI